MYGLSRLFAGAAPLPRQFEVFPRQGLSKVQAQDLRE